ncbi:hypothetical protein AB205_0032540, partial [Aquarana catesbeiana]
GSSNGNPPERCPRPLYSRDSTQEDHTIPHHHQSGNLRDSNIAVKKEFKKADEEYGIMKAFSEGHNDLYKDIMMEPPNNRNPPGRCPHSLHSQDSTQEDHNYSHHVQTQTGNLGDYNIVKEESKEEVEKYGVMKGFSDSYKDVMMEPPGNINLPERCPPPLYSWDSTQEDHIIPHHHQMLSSVILLVSDEGIINLNVGGEVEETYLRDDQQYTEEAGMMRTFIEEDTPTEISTGPAMEKPSKDRLTLSPGCKMEDEDITGDCGGEKTMISTMDGGLHSVDRPWNPSDSEQPRTVRDGAGIQGEKNFSCAEREESFSSELSQHRNHAGEKLYSCSACGKSFAEKSSLDDHLRTHLEGILYSCSECGKCYPQIEKLVEHQKSHTRARPYSCSECGKCYLWKADLVWNMGLLMCLVMDDRGLVYEGAQRHKLMEEEDMDEAKLQGRNPSTERRNYSQNTGSNWLPGKQRPQTLLVPGTR